MLVLTLRDLQYRAVRFGVVVVGTAVVFALLLLMSGLVDRFFTEPRRTVGFEQVEGVCRRPARELEKLGGNARVGGGGNGTG